jgi:hypothetical protein
MTAESTAKTEQRPLYYDEAIRLLSLQEFASRAHTFPHRRLRFQTRSASR